MMRINLLISTMICALLIMMALGENATSIAQEPVTTVTLSTTTLKVSDSGQANAEISCAADGCGAFAITIDFDPTILRVDRAEVGPYLGNQFFVVENAIDNEAGLVRLAAATLGPPPKTEETVLFHLYITGLKAGASELLITELDIGDQAGYPLDAAWVNGTVRVIEEVPASPTSPPRPFPTDTPVPTAIPPSPTETPLSSGPELVSHNAEWTPLIENFEGVDMVLVPAGCFMMGSEQGATDEQPVSQQCFGQPFWLDRFEVTNDQFAEWNGEAALNATWPEGDFPRENISWSEAQDYCEERGGRLPTEREWEYAARGPDGLIYPWGDSFFAGNAVFGDNSGDQPSAVGGRPNAASWVGALDMAGNVSEWVSSQYDAYTYDSADGREDPEDTSSWRVLRGGSWYNTDSFMLRATFRMAYSPSFSDMRVGFRCARDD